MGGGPPAARFSSLRAYAHDEACDPGTGFSSQRGGMIPCGMLGQNLKVFVSN